MGDLTIKDWQNVLEIKNGRDYKKVFDKDGLYPIYGSGGIMGRANDYICPPNTVIIGRKGNINNPIHVNTSFWNVDTAFGLVPKDNVLYSKYLYYFCVNYNFEKLNTTVTIPSLTKSNLLKIKMALPSLNEQKHIADVLDKTQEIIDGYKKQLEELDNLIKAVFYEMFGDPVRNEKGWNIITLKTMIEKANNGLARRGTIQDCNGDIVLRLKELQSNYIDYSDVNRITLNNSEKERYLLFQNDFLFARVNGNPENVGRCATFNEIGEDVYHNDHIIRVTLRKEKIKNEYLCYLLNSEYGKREYRDKLKTSAGQYTINQIGLGNVVIPVPPIELQNKFAEIVAKIEAQKAVVKQAITESQNLFNSLMSEYFE